VGAELRRLLEKLKRFSRISLLKSLNSFSIRVAPLGEDFAADSRSESQENQD
jgi:hypothetical protein